MKRCSCYRSRGARTCTVQADCTEVAGRYPNLRRTSDTTYIEEWQQHRYVRMPRETSHLYLRYFHGGNLWETDHFLRRMRNTPKDLLLYAWHRYVRGDVFEHPRFQLTDRMRSAFGDTDDE